MANVIFADYDINTKKAEKGLDDVDKKIIRQAERLTRLGRIADSTYTTFTVKARPVNNSIDGLNRRIDTLNNRLNRTRSGSQAFQTIAVQAQRAQQRIEAIERARARAVSRATGAQPARDSVDGLNQRLATLNQRLSRTSAGSRSFQLIARQAERAKQKIQEVERAQARAARGARGGGLGGFFRDLASGGGAAGSLGGALSAVVPQAALLTGGLAALAAGAVAVGARILQLGGRLQQTRVAFRVLIGDAEKANATIKELNDFANATPFQNEEVLQAGRNLIAFGVRADQVTKELKRVGDVSAAVGAPLSEIAELYGKAKVSGRVFAEDLNQLTGRGIPVIQELAEQFNVSQSEVRKLVEAGRVGFPHIQEAFRTLTEEGGKFQGMMEEQSKTLPGMISTIVGSFNNFLARIGEKVAPVFEPFLAGVVSVINAGQHLIDVGEQIGDFFGVSLAQIVTWTNPVLRGFAIMREVLGFVSNKAKEVFKVMGPGLQRAGRLLRLVKDEARNLWAALAPIRGVVSGIFRSFTDAAGSKIMSVLKDIAEGFSTGVAGSIEFTIRSIRALIAAIGEVPNVAQNAGDALEHLKFEAMALFDFLESLKDNPVEALKAWRDGAFVVAGSFKDILEETKRDIKKSAKVIRDAFNAPINLPKPDPIKREDVIPDGEEFTVKPKVKKPKKEAAGVFKDIIQQWKDEFEQTNFISKKFGDEMRLVAANWKGTLETMSRNVTAFVNHFQTIFSTVNDIVSNAADMDIEDMNRAHEQRSLIADVWTQQQSRRLAREIDDFRAAEDAKIAELRAAQEERRLMFDEEYNQKKLLLEQELLDILAKDEADFFNKMALIEAGNAGDLQRLENKDLMEEDFRRLKELRESEHEERLGLLREDVNNKKNTSDKELDKEIQEREKNRDKVLEDLRKNKEKKEKEHRKLIAFMNWAVEAQSVKMKAEAESQRIQATGVAQSAAVFANVLSSLSVIPIVGPFIAPPIAAAMSAMVLSQSMRAAAQARTQQVLPPAELFLAEGGAFKTDIAGTNTSDNIPVTVNASRGESFIDAERTNRLINAVDTVTSPQSRGDIIFHFDNPTFVLEGESDVERAESFSEILEERTKSKFNRTFLTRI